jgi:hypothetical protein
MLDDAFVSLFELRFAMAAFGGTSLKPTVVYSNDVALLQALEQHERGFDRRSFTATVQTSTVVKTRAGVAVTGAPGLKSTQPGPWLSLCDWLGLTWPINGWCWKVVSPAIWSASGCASHGWPRPLAVAFRLRVVWRGGGGGICEVRVQWQWCLDLRADLKLTLTGALTGAAYVWLLELQARMLEVVEYMYKNRHLRIPALWQGVIADAVRKLRMLNAVWACLSSLQALNDVSCLWISKRAVTLAGLRCKSGNFEKMPMEKKGRKKGEYPDNKRYFGLCRFPKKYPFRLFEFSLSLVVFQ